MKKLPLFLSALLVAIWLIAIAIISVQNATLVSLQFLNFKSVSLPFGIILAFSAAAGTLAGAIALMLFTPKQPITDSPRSQNYTSRSYANSSDEEEW